MKFLIVIEAALILTASIAEASAYRTGVIISVCEDKPHAVFASSVRKGEDPTRDLHNEAMEICPLGYERTETKISDGDITIIWNIRCRQKEHVAQNILKSCGD